MRTRLLLAVPALLAAACSDEPDVAAAQPGCDGWQRTFDVRNGFAARFFNGNTGVRVAAADDVVLAAWAEEIEVGVSHQVRVALLDATSGDVLRDDVVVPLPEAALVNGLSVEPVDDGFLVFAWTFEPSRLVVAAVTADGDVASVAEVAYQRIAHELPVARLGGDVLGVGVDPSTATPLRVTAGGLVTQSPDAAIEEVDGCSSVVAMPDGTLRAWCSAINFIEAPTAAELWRFDADGTLGARVQINRHVPARPGQLVPTDDGLLVVVGIEGGVVAALLDADGAVLDGPTTIVALKPFDLASEEGYGEEGLQGQWIEPSIGFEVVPHGDGAVVVYEHWERHLLIASHTVVRTARIAVRDGAIVVDDDGQGAASEGYGHGAARADDDVLLGYLAGHPGLPTYTETVEVERRCLP